MRADIEHGDLDGTRVEMVPRGGETRWEVTSPWPHPSFGGSFLPDVREVGGEGFSATFGITNLALGQALATTDDPGPPNAFLLPEETEAVMTDTTGARGQAMAASIVPVPAPP